MPLAPAEKQRNYRERKRNQHKLAFETSESGNVFIACSCAKFRKRLSKITTPREAAALAREHEREVALMHR